MFYFIFEPSHEKRSFKRTCADTMDNMSELSFGSLIANVISTLAHLSLAI